jgi:type II secretory pathway component PulJ
MKCSTANPDARGTAGFTLAEVLAALLFMAIVIPVTLEGLQIASRAGDVSRCKCQAVRVAERLLNETLIQTNTTTISFQNGMVEEDGRQFQWSLRSDSWEPDMSQKAPRLVTVKVSYLVRGTEYWVNLWTLSNSQR